MPKLSRNKKNNTLPKLFKLQDYIGKKIRIKVKYGWANHKGVAIKADDRSVLLSGMKFHIHKNDILSIKIGY